MCSVSCLEMLDEIIVFILSSPAVTKGSHLTQFGKHQFSDVDSSCCCLNNYFILLYWLTYTSAYMCGHFSKAIVRYPGIVCA